MKKAADEITKILKACGCAPVVSGNKIKVNAPTIKGGKKQCQQ